MEGRGFRPLFPGGDQRHPQVSRPRHSCVPSSRSSQSSRLCPRTLLGSGRLRGGAATRYLTTSHQEGERESRSKQTVGLRALRPDALSQSTLYRRKEHQAGCARYRPVRPQAPALPSGGTRSQSAAAQMRVPAKACQTRPAPASGPARSAPWLCRGCVRAWRSTPGPVWSAVNRGPPPRRRPP
jgi:hypothetical protein